eukprot:scaffold4373_cov143-Isochrysis_galbana.AAC.1
MNVAIVCFAIDQTAAWPYTSVGYCLYTDVHMWCIAAFMFGSWSVAGLILASALVGGRSSSASSATTIGKWSEAAFPVNIVGSAAAAIHRHDVFSVGPLAYVPLAESVSRCN